MWLALGVMCLGARFPWALQRWLGRGIGALALLVAADRRRVDVAVVQPDITNCGGIAEIKRM